MEIDDEDLMRRFQSGDEKAYETLVLRNVDFVIRHARRYIKDRAGAEDVAQDVFFRVWKSKDRFREAKSFRGWLSTMTTRIALNEIRTRTRKRWKPRSTLGSDEFDEVGQEWLGGSQRSTDPSKDLLQSERAEMVHQAIAQLGEPARQAILLHYFEGWQITRIAETLNMSDSALKSLLFRTRKKLMVILDLPLQGDVECD